MNKKFINSNIAISVCICTFRRPQMLSELLDAVGAQQWNFQAGEIEVIVVDNDGKNSALSVLESWKCPLHFHFKFFHASESNISIARNKAIENASGEFIAWIDDDELPVVDWLQKLFETLKKHNADAVFAPVLPSYLPETPQWIITGGYFDRPRFKTGSLIDHKNTRTGNVLIKTTCLQSLINHEKNIRTGPFDIDFGCTGGEDSLLFRALLKNNLVFVWSDEAVVSEVVPSERANAKWLLLRYFRVGQIWMRTELHLLIGFDKYVISFYLALKSTVQLFISIAIAVLVFPFSRIKSFQWIRTAAMQLGKISGLTKFKYKAYGR